MCNCVLNFVFIKAKITSFFIWNDLFFIYLACKNSSAIILIKHISFKIYFYKTIKIFFFKNYFLKIKTIKNYKYQSHDNCKPKLINVGLLNFEIFFVFLDYFNPHDGTKQRIRNVRSWSDVVKIPLPSDLC